MGFTTPRILVTGAVGQIGSELTLALRERYGADNVVAAGHRTPPSPALRDSGPFETVDVTAAANIVEVVERHRIDTIYHLAAILSAVGEANPQLAWNVNINGLYNVLEVARERGIRQVFCPSSIAVFGPETPARPHAAGDDPAPHDDVWRHQGGGRAAVRLLRAPLWAGCARRALPRASSPARRCPAAAPPTMPWPSSTRRWPRGATPASCARTRSCR